MSSNNQPVPNELLAALPKKYYQALRSQMVEVPLTFEATIYLPNEVIDDVYFPNSGIVSILAGNSERSTIEVGMVGKEGMAGLSVFMGVNSAINRVVVQGAGSAMKMKASAFRKESSDGGPLPRILQRYAHSLITQITQSAVCNQFHTLDSRLSRWLLMTHDRLGDDDFLLTQEFLSNMLGVRREGVSGAARNLQDLDLIRYSRGRLKVLDRSGLEAKSCVCYTIIKNEGRT